MADVLDYEDLPGGDLVATGLADIAADRPETVEALLVWIAEKRLRALGIPIPGQRPVGPDAELRLYRALAARNVGQAPYPPYNALLRRLVSFCRAVSCLQPPRSSDAPGRGFSTTRRR